MNETEHAKAGKRVDVQQLRLWCPFPRVPFLEHSAPFCSSSLTESLKPTWTIKGNPRISNYDWVVMESDCILRRRKDCSLLVWRIFWGFRSLNKHGAITLHHHHHHIYLNTWHLGVPKFSFKRVRVLEIHPTQPRGGHPSHSNLVRGKLTSPNVSLLDVPPLKTCHSTSYHAGIWRVKWQDYQGRTLWNLPELLM